MWVQPLGQEDPTPALLLGESQAEEPGGLQPMRAHRVGCSWVQARSLRAPTDPEGAA